MLILSFNDTATTEIYPLSLHDALPISVVPDRARVGSTTWRAVSVTGRSPRSEEHTSELQSRFGISYAVLCLKKTIFGQKGLAGVVARMEGDSSPCALTR